MWDVRSSKLLFSAQNQKTVTACRLLPNRLLTASLDQHMKVYSLEDLSVTHQWKMAYPIMDFCIGDGLLAIGGSDGSFEIRKYNKNV